MEEYYRLMQHARVHDVFIFSLGKTVNAFHVLKIFYAFITESLIIVFPEGKIV